MSTIESTALQQKIEKARELFADAPEMAKVALENAIRDMEPETAAPPTESAGRVGRRQGSVSEFTLIAPLDEGAGRRLRGVLDLLDGNFQGAEKVGTVHDMRFVFLDDDTKVLFVTAYDGDWDSYINDFATQIPDYMDILFGGLKGWPGIRSPLIKDYLAKYQLSAAAWYVANPDLTVADTRRLKRVGAAVDEFLDKIG